jgi:hypothetical protein
VSEKRITMTKAVRFKQSDITRFFKGAQKANVELSRVEIDPFNGRLIAHVGPAIAAPAPAGGANEWDGVLLT